MCGQLTDRAITRNSQCSRVCKDNSNDSGMGNTFNYSFSCVTRNSSASVLPGRGRFILTFTYRKQFPSKTQDATDWDLRPRSTLERVGVGMKLKGHNECQTCTIRCILSFNPCPLIVPDCVLFLFLHTYYVGKVLSVCSLNSYPLSVKCFGGTKKIRTKL